MKILIADKLSENALLALQQSGMKIDSRPDLAADELPGLIADFNVLVVRSTRVSAETVAAADNLSLIVRAGAGVNTIDVDAASDRGIYVTNCPGQNSDAVAELAIGLLIACDRRIANATSELRSGSWNKKEYSKANGLRGRTLGIVGMGAIGSAVARGALGLGMQVIAWSRSLTSERAKEMGIRHAESPIDVAKSSDAVSVHLAASPETRNLINAAFLDAMPDEAIFINTSRGDVVNTTDLKAAIESKRLRVGLDVFEEEPGSGTADFEQTELAGVSTCTPHIGASTQQAADAIASEAVRIINEFRATGRPPNAVNISAKTPATHSLVIRHYNRVGVLASVLDALREEDINVEEMENLIFSGASAACCTLQIDQAPTSNLIEQLSNQGHVIQVHLEPR